MKLESQVCSLQLAKDLKKAGYPQEGLWCHIDNLAIGYEGIKLVTQTQAYRLKRKLFDAGVIKYFVAPTVAELGLPAGFATCKTGQGKYIAFSTGDIHGAIDFPEILSDTEANARAKMWLYLKKEKK